MLKATAATTAGAVLFSGSAAATEPDQINWCGCSQVCISGGNGNFVVITGEEDSSASGDGVYDGWQFRAYGFRFRSGAAVCFEPAEDGGAGGPDEKVLAVARLSNDVFDCYYCNPGNCADNSGAKGALLDYDGLVPVISGLARTRVPAPDDCAESCDGDPAPTIVEGRCGEPGGDAPPRGRDNNNGK